MKFRHVLCAVVLISAASFLGRAENPAPAGNEPVKATPVPHHGVLNRVFRDLHLTHTSEDVKKEKEEKKLPNFKHLYLSMRIDPPVVNLADTRRMNVVLTLQNKGDHFVELEFPTSQRIEVLVKDSKGKLVEHWSEDHAFENEPSVVTINPGEHLQYSAEVATRDMKAGQPYTVEGFFPNFEPLHSTTVVVPH